MLFIMLALILWGAVIGAYAYLKHLEREVKRYEQMERDGYFDELKNSSATRDWKSDEQLIQEGYTIPPRRKNIWKL